MKMRIGFVSNSSSASYIIDANKSVFQVALDMLEIRNKDWEDVIDEKQDIEQQVILNSKLDENTPIAFNTTNYDTYIVKIGSMIAIATCNNHSFYDAFDNCFWRETPLSKLKELVEFVYGKADISKFDFDCFLEDLEVEMSKRIEFWWPKYDVMGKQLDERCDKHYENLVEVSGKKICLSCEKEENNEN